MNNTKKISWESTKSYIKNNISSATAFIALIIVFITFAILTEGKTLAANNLKNVLLQALLVIISAVGTIHISSHGNIDMALGAVIGVSSVVGFVAGNGSNLLVMTLVCVLVGVACSSFIGVVHAKVGVPAFFVGIVGLTMGTKFTQIRSAQTAMNVDFKLVAKLDRFEFYFIIAVAIILIIGFLFNYTKIGKYNKAIGDNSVCANLSGINVVKYKIIAFALSGAVSGLAAILRMFRSGAVTNTTGSGVQMNVMIAIIVGGVSVAGGNRTRIKYAIVGALLIQILTNGLILMGVDVSLVGLIKGIVFLFAAWLSFDKSQTDLVI